MVFDVVLVLTLVGIGIAGYRQGFVTGVLNLVGLVLGAFAGMQIAPKIAEWVSGSTRQALAGMVVVLVAAAIGQLVGTAIGSAIRGRIRWRPVQRIDAVGGGLVSTAGILIIAWLIGTELKDSPFVGLAQQVKGSRVLRAVDGVMPPAPDVAAPFRRLISREGFPQVFADIRGGRSRAVPPPDPAVISSQAVTSSRQSIVRVTGIARECSHRVEGTGFVYADGLVMTNAHVIAGVRSAKVSSESGDTHDARIVLFDPKRDVAVLRVEDLDLPALEFAGPQRTGDNGVVAGYPEDGPFTAVAARVRDQLTAVGRDIYERGIVRREVYAIRAKVLPGNSGGPLLTPDGRVSGVVFASAADDPDTGYALTADEVASSAAAGRRSDAVVSTGACS